VNVCIDPLGVVCSAIYKNYAVQLFKIYGVVYFGETVKVCANIAYLMISINRYMLIGKEQG
jgi:hypothetical protein